MSAPAFCLGRGDHWQSEEADSGATGCHIMHKMDFWHLSVIVRVGGAEYQFALVYITPPNNKSKPVCFICIDQLVVPVLMSSNMSETEYGLGQNSECLFHVDGNSSDSLFCCIAELVAGLSVLGTHS